MRRVVPNPGVFGGRRPVKLVQACGEGRKPVEAITDRAKRYRANSAACKPEGPKRCEYCGSGKNVGVHHRDGNEDNGRRSNLAWACKSCNGRIAVQHKRQGKGKRVRQYNPKAGRVPTFGEYMAAAAEHQRGAHDAAGKVIHATPKWLRQEYAKRAWDIRRQRYGGGEEVPF